MQLQQVQLQFERAQLVKEFLPAIADDKTNIVTKAYLLRSAIVTGAIDPRQEWNSSRAHTSRAGRDPF